VSRRFRSRQANLPRLRLRASTRLLVVFLIFLTIVLGSVYMLDRRFRPIVTTASSALAHRAGAIALMDALTSQIKVDGPNLDLLTTVEQPSGTGTVTITQVDMSKLTLLQSDATRAAQERLQQFSQQTIRLPLVQMFSGSLISRTTMSIPVRVSMLGSVHSAIESDVKTQGVNQVVHIIYLHLTADVMVVTPFVTAPTTIEAKAPIAYIVMAGRVPNSYLNPTTPSVPGSITPSSK
jgi:sporulation protein YunB